MSKLAGEEHELGVKPVGVLLRSYSIPAMVGLVSNGLYNMVDTIFVGQAVGKEGLAALQVAFPVQITVLASALTIAVGAACIVSRALGAGDRPLAIRTAGSAVITVILLCLALTVLFLAFLDPVINVCGATPNVVPHARDYLGVVMLGNTFLGLAALGNHLLRAEGAALASMVAMFIGALSNIAMDALFMLGFGMGVEGAALATVLAQFLAATYLLCRLGGGKTILRMGRDDLRLRLRLLPEILGVGVSTMIRLGGDSVLMIFLNRTVRRYGGDVSGVYLAVCGLFVKLLQFINMPLIGILQGLRPIVGFNYGAGRLDRVRRGIVVAAVCGTVVSTIAFAVLMLIPRTVLGVFTDDVEVLDRGVPVLRTVILLMPLLGLQMLGAGVFQALGRARPAFVLSLARRLLFVVPLVILLPLRWGLDGVWYAFPLADACVAVLTVGCLWHFNKWLRENHLAVSEAPAE